MFPEEISVIEHPFFQRLRNIKQLGFSEYVFPGATHSRYLHSIGVLEVATRAFDQLFKHLPDTNEKKRLKETVRMACLLHDIGHAPLSHTTEFVMPNVSELQLPNHFVEDNTRQATHEDYTIKSIIDSSFTSSFTKVVNKFGITHEQVAELIIGRTKSDDYFTINNVNYFPLLHQLVSSEMDCDRMDYLLRDSYFCGVSYGKFDLDWIIDNLRVCQNNGKAFIGISERAVATFDDFLLCRYHMFMMVYFHYKAVCLEKVLERYFMTSSNEYTIPANIEQYLEYDDHHLMKHLKNSQNIWAQRVVTNNIPQKVFEAFGQSNIEKLKTLETFLKNNSIDYIKCSSEGRLSKYYSANMENPHDFPLKVISESALTKFQFATKDINNATDLFEKFSRAHTVSRLHCDFENLKPNIQKEILNIIEK